MREDRNARAIPKHDAGRRTAESEHAAPCEPSIESRDFAVDEPFGSTNGSVALYLAMSQIRDANIGWGGWPPGQLQSRHVGEPP